MVSGRSDRRRSAVRGGVGGLGLAWALSLAAARFGWVPWEPGPATAVGWVLPTWALPLWAGAACAGAALLWFGPLQGRGFFASCGWLLASAVVVLPAACSRAQWAFLFRVVWPIGLLASGLAWVSVRRPPALRWRHVGSALFVVMAAAALQTTAYLRFLGAHGPHTGDEGHYLVQARSIVEDLDTDIANQIGLEPGGPVKSPARRYYHVSHQSAPGHLYSRHPAGLPILLAPFFLLGGDAWSGLAVVLAAILAAWNIHAAAREAGCAPAAARDIWLLYALSSPFVVFGARVYPEMPGALWALYAARVVAHPSRSRARWILGAVAVATLPWLHAPRFWPAAVILAGWGLFAAARRRDAAAIATWCVLIGLGWVWLGWWNHLRFSGGASVLEASVASGYGADMPSRFSLKGLLEAFLSGRKGLALVAPSLVAVIVLGIWGAWRHRRDAGAVIPALAFLGGVGPLLVTGYWYGGHAAHPGRVLVVSLPLLAMPAARLFRDAPRPLANPALRMALAMSTAATVWMLARPWIFDDPLQVLRRSDPAAVGFLALLPTFHRGRNPFVDQPAALAAVLLAAGWWVARGMWWSHSARRGSRVRPCDLALPIGFTLLLALPRVFLPAAILESQLAFVSAARIDPAGGGLRLRATPHHGRPAAPQVTVRADEFTGTVGAVESTPAGGVVRVADVAGGGDDGWLITGPGLQLAPGSYRVELALADVGPDVRARWDARIGAGAGKALFSLSIEGGTGDALEGEFELEADETVAVRLRLWQGRIAVGPLRIERLWTDPVWHATPQGWDASSSASGT